MKKKNITKLIDQWIHRLGLRWWTIDIFLIDDPKEIIETFRITETEICIAKTFCDWRYATANIFFNFPDISIMHKDDIKRVVIHELCHVLVNEMRQEGIDHEERTVTNLTKAFIWTEANCLSEDQGEG